MNFHDIFNREGKANAHKHKADMHEKSVVPVSIELAQRIQTIGADHGHGERTPAYAVSTIQLLMIHRTTYLHKDEDDEGMMTVMVFLEDNEDAYFWIEELGQKIPVEKGKLVAFDARFTHNTVIKDMENGKASSVYLLGPTRVRPDAVANDSINVQRKLETNITGSMFFDVAPKGNYSISVDGNATYVTNARFDGTYSASFLVNKGNGTQAMMAVNNCFMRCSSANSTCATAVQTTPSPTPATGKSGKEKIRN